MSPWLTMIPPPPSASIIPTALGAVFDVKPEVLVIGQGAYGRMTVPAETCRALERAGIEVVAERTGQAVETYNRFAQERPTAAVLHLTC